MSRYPYTESADFLRSLQKWDQPISRGDAAEMKRQCAEICKIDEKEMAMIFADAARFRKIAGVAPLLFVEATHD